MRFKLIVAIDDDTVCDPTDIAEILEVVVSDLRADGWGQGSGKIGYQGETVGMWELEEVTP